MGVEASTIGNHEFDLGSTVFRDAFTPAGAWRGALFPYLSANLDFSGDSALNPRFTNTVGRRHGTLIPEASTLKGRIAPAAVITEGGQKIGLVGATTQLIESISSPNGTEVKGFPTGPGANGEVDDMDLLAAQLQPIIDEMIAEGVNKIILTSHLQQIANEQLLATKLHGVDIILSAGSNTRLGDADDEAVAFPGHEASLRRHLSDRHPGHRRQDDADRQHRRRVHLSRPPGGRLRRRRRDHPRARWTTMSPSTAPMPRRRRTWRRPGARPSATSRRRPSPTAPRATRCATSPRPSMR